MTLIVPWTSGRPPPHTIRPVLETLASDARAAAALAALLALPGLLVVRSPWRAMPLLSLSFWVLSWTWLGGLSRSRWLQASLFAFAALALLRLLRGGPWPAPSRALALLAVVASLLFVPFLVWPIGPGWRQPLESASALLVSWRDGWPDSFEPLLAARPFRASGVAMLAGDVVLLSGAAAHRAALLVALAGQAVLLLALWSLAATASTPGWAAVLAATAVVATAAPPGTGPGALAVALAAESAALGRGGRGIPSAFAAGACAAAAVAVDVAAGLAALAMVIAAARHVGAADGRRTRTALGTALVLALPLVVRHGLVMSPEIPPLVALAGILLFEALAPRATRPWPRGIAPVALAAAAVCAAVITSRVEPPLDAGQRALLASIRQRARPLDVVCAPPTLASAWIPALTGHATTAPLAPGLPPASGPCAIIIESSGIWTSSRNR